MQVLADDTFLTSTAKCTSNYIKYTSNHVRCFQQSCQVFLAIMSSVVTYNYASGTSTCDFRKGTLCEIGLRLSGRYSMHVLNYIQLGV